MTDTKKAPAKKPAEKLDEAQAAQSPKDRRAELNKQFEEADEKGKAAIIDETQAGLGVRGY